MEFRIADTFTESLARLTGDEQKAVKTTAFDLQINPASPGMSFHRLAKSRDRGFSSVRVNQDVRIIVHRTAQRLLLCYVDHHDRAYAWAERRKLEAHPTTGAAQLVEVRERVQEVLIPAYVPEKAAVSPKPPLFANTPEAELLGYGVPPEWMADVREATEDTLLSVVDHLPAEAAEALLELATGGAPRKPQPVTGPADPFEHPDARRRFRVVADVDELARALDYPWERWIVFLHPAQRELVERRFGGHGEDRRRPALRRAPGPRQSRRAGAAHDLLGGAGQRAPDQARAPDRHGATNPRAHRRGAARHRGAPASRPDARARRDGLARRRATARARSRPRRDGSGVLAGIPPLGVDRGGRSSNSRMHPGDALHPASRSTSAPDRWSPGCAPRGRDRESPLPGVARHRDDASGNPAGGGAS